MARIKFSKTGHPCGKDQKNQNPLKSAWICRMSLITSIKSGEFFEFKVVLSAKFIWLKYKNRNASSCPWALFVCSSSCRDNFFKVAVLQENSDFVRQNMKQRGDLKTWTFLKGCKIPASELHPTQHQVCQEFCFPVYSHHLALIRYLLLFLVSGKKNWMNREKKMTKKWTIRSLTTYSIVIPSFCNKKN